MHLSRVKIVELKKLYPIIQFINRINDLNDEKLKSLKRTLPWNFLGHFMKKLLIKLTSSSLGRVNRSNLAILCFERSFWCYY